MNNNYKFETLQLHVGQEQPDPATDSRAVPIYQTTSYVFRNCAHAAARFGLTDAGNIYGRLTNSTQDVLEKRLAALEGGVAALATASGAAAISYTIQALAQAGDHIVAQKTIYGGSYNLLAHTLPQFGVSTTFVNSHDLTEVENAIQDNTKAIYLETLGNPNSDIPDIDAIAAIAHRHGLPLVIDNTFVTPLCLISSPSIPLSEPFTTLTKSPAFIFSLVISTASSEKSNKKRKSSICLSGITAAPASPFSLRKATTPFVCSTFTCS